MSPTRKNLDPTGVFGAVGLLAGHMKGFEHRPEQERMMAAVSDAIAHDDVCLVEAGTGVGKTLAYLVPALQSGVRAIVATGTRALMDQIRDSDVPLLQQSLPQPFSVAVLKGRANYLCPLRFQAEWEEFGLFGGEERDLARDVRSWMRGTGTGDLAELREVREGHPFLRRVVSTSDTCPGRACPVFSDCFLFRARAQAMEADLVITNHHLFFADLVMSEDGSGSILPDDSVLVLDEAHGLVDVATDHFGRSVRSGGMADLGTDAEALALRGDPAHTRVLLKVARRLEKRFLKLVSNLVGPDSRTAVTPGMGGDGARKAWHDLDVDLEILGEEAAGVAGEMDVESDIRPRAGRFRETLASVLADDEPAFVRIAERRGRRASMSALPIDVSGMLKEKVFLSGRPVVLVSATLTVGGSTRFARNQMGVPDGAAELVVSSPYDFEGQVLLYLPKGLPEPNGQDYYEAFSKEALRIVAATGGRAFLLFTSYAGMRKAHDLMKDELGFPVLMQGEAPRDELLRRFRSNHGTCLFGTHTFWQGVDVMGDALSCVIIDRLPFDPPDDPVLEARRDRVAAGGGKPFYDYQLPLAVIKLRQGFGRLVRRRSDTGVVAIMDVRINTRKYGETFLASLPPAGRTSDPDELEAWCRKRLKGAKAVRT